MEGAMRCRQAVSVAPRLQMTRVCFEMRLPAFWESGAKENQHPATELKGSSERDLNNIPPLATT